MRLSKKTFNLMGVVYVTYGRDENLYSISVGKRGTTTTDGKLLLVVVVVVSFRGNKTTQLR
jgi:hypothetical protein